MEYFYDATCRECGKDIFNATEEEERKELLKESDEALKESFKKKAKMREMAKE